MSLSQRLDIRQSQTLVMTPQLQQAIKLLQMSNQELGEFVAAEIEKNPLLERGDEAADFGGETGGSDGATTSEAGETAVVGYDEPAPLSGKEDETAPAAGEDSWAADGTSGDEAFTPAHSQSSGDDGFNAAENVAGLPSLRDHLMEQIQVDFTEPVARLIAVALIELLDEAGYLPAELEVVRTQLGATPDQFEGVIARLQRCDPPGIFARSLKECLALQLRDKNRLDPAMDMLLQHLDLLAKREKAQLMRLCGVDAEDLTQMIEEIRQLNPKPAQIFAADVALPIVPDVMLRAARDGWHVELNNDTLPRVLANQRYYTQVQAAAVKKADKEYLSDRWQQANWLKKALEQRANTILKVAAEIVKQQDSFFIHGVQHLKPLILKDIAAAVEMHESTVSRVTQNKFITTPRGLFELKYFFTTALTRSDGGDAISSASVRDRIRRLIEGESPAKVLSDDALAELLQREGIDVARRTVAKYREALGLPSSAQRRRDKRAM